MAVLLLPRRSKGMGNRLWSVWRTEKKHMWGELEGPSDVSNGWVSFGEGRGERGLADCHAFLAMFPSMGCCVFHVHFIIGFCVSVVMMYEDLEELYSKAIYVSVMEIKCK